MLQTVHSLVLLILIIISPLCIFAQTTDNITVESSITAAHNSNKWLSPSGDFAFGFLPLQNNTFVLSIWFNKLPDKTIVWFERTSYPVPAGSTLQLTAAQGLELRDSTSSLRWNSNGLSDEIIAYGLMNDTGNFILSGRNSTLLWESFRNPADTILPTQTIEINKMLVSRTSQTNFSQGKYSAVMKQSGDFSFQAKRVWMTTFDNEYYNSGTSNASNSGSQALFGTNGVISIMRQNGDPKILTQSSGPPSSDNYYRATLGFDGVFTLYFHPKSFSGNPGWSALTSLPDNICTSLSGACGYNSICTLGADHRPVCRCPQGFTLVHPEILDGDCLPILNPNCVAGENSSAFELLEIDDTNWLEHDYEHYPSSEEDCKNSCLSDCLCGISVYVHQSSLCFKKSFPLENGRIDTSGGTRAFLKLRKGSSIPRGNPNLSTPNQPSKEGKKTLIMAGSVLLGTSVFINLLFIFAVCLGCVFIYRKKIQYLNLPQSSAGVNLRCFTYRELVQATNGFRDELGRGAFGIVYKGQILDCPESVVAVKKLDRVSEDSEKEFKAEVNAIGQTHHKNLVRLLGFCNEGPNRLIVYEYMSNGSLADFLFGTVKRSWSLRSQIALGVARGLTYLHDECGAQIIHCDIKPQNILVDEYYNGRISDFGLAKLLKMNQTRTLTNIRGTKGYVAPEWFRNTQITAKVDVYSFGVLLLEIIACRKNVESMEDDENIPILTDQVWDCFQENRLDSLVDDDVEALSDRKRLERFVMVGIWCVQEDASLRPTMRKASQMLEGIVDVGKPPCPSPFSLMP